MSLKQMQALEQGLKQEPPCKTGSQCTTKCMECAEPEPVAVVSGYYGGKCVVLPTDPARIFNSGTAFYTNPPKCEWQGLTDEDVQEVIKQSMQAITGGSNTFTLSANSVWTAIVRAVEAKLKGKNT